MNEPVILQAQLHISRCRVRGLQAEADFILSLLLHYPNGPTNGYWYEQDVDDWLSLERELAELEAKIAWYTYWKGKHDANK